MCRPKTATPRHLITESTRFLTYGLPMARGKLPRGTQKRLNLSIYWWASDERVCITLVPIPRNKSTHISSINLCFCLLIHPSIDWSSYLNIFCVPVHSSFYPPIHLSLFHLSIYLFVTKSFHPYVHRSVLPFIDHCIYQSFHLVVHPSTFFNSSRFDNQGCLRSVDE